MHVRFSKFNAEHMMVIKLLSEPVHMGIKSTPEPLVVSGNPPARSRVHALALEVALVIGLDQLVPQTLLVRSSSNSRLTDVIGHR